MNIRLEKLRTWYYIFKYQLVFRKIRFGKNPVIRSRLSIKGPGKVLTGDNCIFEPDPFGDDHVTLYTHQKDAKIVIGDNVLLRATRFGSHLGIEIRNRAVLESAAIFDSDFHNVDSSRRDEGFNENDRRVVIGQGAYVGMECICSKGTQLGDNVVLVASSVTGSRFFPAETKFGGFPARKTES